VPKRIGQPRQIITPELRDSYRRAWLVVVEGNPGMSRCEVRAALPKAFNWLYRCDRDWLEANSPARLRSSGPPPRIDWVRRDAELAKAVRALAAEMKATPSRPVRASATALANKAGCLTLTIKRPELVPGTLKALAEVSESAEAYAASSGRPSASGARGWS
jgi:hypothetical protein